MALDEFQDLRKKYDLEVECRRKAEEYASQVTKQNKTKLSLSLSRLSIFWRIGFTLVFKLFLLRM